VSLIVFSLAAPADTPPASAAPQDNSLPQDGLFSSVGQSLRGADREIVRGHFDLGSPPNVHRYYCLIDPKTGHRQPNGVVGDPAPNADGTTGIKSNAVSLYTCRKAEERGLLVTDGYLVPGSSAAPAAAQSASVAAPAASNAPAQTAAPRVAAEAAAAPLREVPAAPQVAADRIDVTGVRLGMSPDDVRAVFKSKGLAHYKEWTETLSYVDSTKQVMRPVANGEFLNVIATWAEPGSSASNEEGEGESYEVMFTPVPGKERAMVIIHSEGFASGNAIHETALDAGLVRKYGGFASAGELPQSPTWRFRSSGSVEVGDACNRRRTFGGLGNLSIEATPPANIALKRSAEEFRSEVERCGWAIVSEDHHTLNGGALPQDRLVTRFTVTAYSPSLAFEGAKGAEQIIRASSPAAAAPKDQAAPNL
jgi:hypothetical protein